MTNITKLIHSSIFLVLICTSITFANDESNINKMQIENLTYTQKDKYNINEIISIETKEINENSDFFKSEIKCPYLKIKQQYLDKQNIYNKQLENINKTISEDVMKFYQEIKYYSQSYKEEYEKNKDKYDYMIHQYVAYTNYEIKYSKNNIISIPVVYSQYTGGLHGLSEIRTYNYDLVTGKEIQLKDLFKADCNYEDIINKNIQDKIDKDTKNYFGGDYGFKGITKNQKFYIEEDGIVVYFGEYEIAPYSTGIPEFKIQFDEISNCLNNPLN